MFADISSTIREKVENSQLLNWFTCYHLPYYRFLMILQLSLFVALPFAPSYIWPVLASIVTAIVVDSLYVSSEHFLDYDNYAFPSGAVITSIIVSSITFPGQFLPAVGITLLSLILKQIIKLNYRNIFNPAALGLYIGSVLGVSLTWWASGSIWVFVLGLIVAFLIKVEDLALSFLIPYWILTILFDPSLLSNFLGLLSSQAVFFAFIMVVEPVTSPNLPKNRILFGIGVAILAFLFQFVSSSLLVDNFLVALLTMNVVHRLIDMK